MTPSRTEQSDPATLAASEGQAALGRGDTVLARTKFVEAGEILLRDVAGAYKHSDKVLLRFLAATQFYKAGEYQRALELTKKIEARLLPANTRGLLPQFIRDVESRASPDYVSRMRQTFARLWAVHDSRQILDLFKDHPYVYPPGVLAFLRASVCEELGQWRAAAIFYAIALHHAPKDSEYMLLPGGCILQLPARERLHEAWEYTTHLLELAPNALVYMIASILCFIRASRLPRENRLALYQEQLRYFDEASRAFPMLSVDRQNDPEMRLVMSMCFDWASLSLAQLGDAVRARALVNEAITFDPTAPGPLSTRGMLTYPSEQAIMDFRKATGFQRASYVPFYFLAHNAFTTGDFREAITFCQEALDRNPGRPITAQLYSWVAMCEDCLGADRVDVELFFQKARDIDPENDLVAANYRIFQEAHSTSPKTPVGRWSTPAVDDGIDPGSVVREAERVGGVTQVAACGEMRLAG